MISVLYSTYSNRSSYRSSEVALLILYVKGAFLLSLIETKAAQPELPFFSWRLVRLRGEAFSLSYLVIARLWGIFSPWPPVTTAVNISRPRLASSDSYLKVAMVIRPN